MNKIPHFITILLRNFYAPVSTPTVALTFWDRERAQKRANEYSMHGRKSFKLQLFVSYRRKCSYFLLRWNFYNLFIASNDCMFVHAVHRNHEILYNICLSQTCHIFEYKNLLEFRFLASPFPRLAGFDCAGNDLDNSSYNNVSIDDCEAMCLARANCSGYSHRALSRQCWIKSKTDVCSASGYDAGFSRMFVVCQILIRRELKDFELTHATPTNKAIKSTKL